MKADDVKTGNGKDLDEAKTDTPTSDEKPRETTLNGDDEEKAGDSGLQLIGQTIAERYEILALLGSGGMSKVYKARQVLTKKIVAIKMLHQHLITNAQVLRRFQKEAEAASRLSHPHIITVHDFGPAGNDQWYLVMDYLEGVPLSDVIKTWGKVDIERCFRIFIQACDALAHAHKLGVLHRDLKPSNIMLVPHDNDPDYVKIVDFGIAKIIEDGEMTRQQLTQTGEVFGSPLYMSPEQCLGKATDARADIYSMGCLMYEALTGKPPLVGDNILETMYKQMNEMPAGLDKQLNVDVRLVQRVENIVFKALSKDPAQRQQSFDELRDALEIAQHEKSSGLALIAQTLMNISHIRHLARNKLGQHWKLFVTTCSVFAIAFLALLIFVMPAYGPGEEPALSNRFMEWKFPKNSKNLPKISTEDPVHKELLREMNKGLSHIGDPFHTTKKLADHSLAAGQRTEALGYYLQARDLGAERNLENSVDMAQIYTGIARIYLDRVKELPNAPGTAVSYASRADAIYDSLGWSAERLVPLLEKADGFVESHDTLNARKAFQELITVWERLNQPGQPALEAPVKRGYITSLMHICNFASCRDQLKRAEKGKTSRENRITFFRKDDAKPIDAIQLNNELIKTLSEYESESESSKQLDALNIAVAHNRIGMEYLEEGKNDWPSLWSSLQRVDFRGVERSLKNLMSHNHAAVKSFQKALKAFRDEGNEDTVSAWFNLADAQWASFEFIEALESRAQARKTQRDL